MSGTSNIYGVKYLTLTVDGNPVYKRVIDRFSFDNTRGVNTIVDYAGVVRNNSWMMTSRVAAARPLGDMIEAVDNGVLDINEERDYKCLWILEDEHGNTRRVPFTITGVRHDIPEAVHKGDMLSWKGHNVYSGNGIKASFPAGTFYDDIYLKVTSEPIVGYVTDRFTVGDPTIPVSGEYTIEIDIDRDTVPDKTNIASCASTQEAPLSCRRKICRRQDARNPQPIRVICRNYRHASSGHKARSAGQLGKAWTS